MDRRPPTLDMRLDGSFRPAQRLGLPFQTKLLIGAVLVAITGGAIAMAAVAVWVLSMVLPVVLGAAVIAWGLLQFRRWQDRGGRAVRSNQSG